MLKQFYFFLLKSIAEEKSLYHTQKAPKGIVWRRPHQVIKNPQFVVDGFNRCDMDQGYVGNCWFIAGCVGIMQSPTCFAKVVPQNQSFTEDYAGIAGNFTIIKLLKNIIF